MSEVKFFRLATGEEVVATVLSDSKSHYTVKNPLVLMMTQDGQTDFYPLFPYCKTDSIKVNKNMIEFDLEPGNELIEAYNKSFPVVVKFGINPTESGCGQ